MIHLSNMNTFPDHTPIIYIRLKSGTTGIWIGNIKIQPYYKFSIIILTFKLVCHINHEQIPATGRVGNYYIRSINHTRNRKLPEII